VWKVNKTSAGVYFWKSRMNGVNGQGYVIIHTGK